MLRSLRSRLWLLFLAFLLLVIASVAVTFVAVASQRHDALLINLTGRQRMLSQQMTWLALSDPDDPALLHAVARFEQTLAALTVGGEAVDAQGRSVALPRVTDVLAQAELTHTGAAWSEFRAALDQVTTQQAPSTELTAAALTLLASLDRVVDRLSALAQAHVAHLLLIQTVFLVLALGLLAWGYQLTRHNVVAPLAALGASAQRMAAGDLEQTTPHFPDQEISRLAHALDAMRIEVLASRRQLEARVDRRTRELTTAFEFSQEITAQLELAHLLESVTDRARVLMGGRAAALCLLDEQAGQLRLVAGSGEGRADLTLRQPVAEELPRQVIGEGRTVVTETACAGCGFLRRLPGNHCVATPLRAGGTTLGALCVVRPQAALFEAEEQAAFALLANAAAVAIVNARLVEDGRRQAEENATQAERARLAADLHDNLAQTLSFLNFKVDRLHELIAAGETGTAEQELAHMRGATTRAYAQVRAALTGLRLPEAEPDAFIQRLTACIQEVTDATGLAAHLEICTGQPPAFSPVVQQQVLHIVREALVNVWRHAQAERVQVSVGRDQAQAVITVVDDGCGFDPTAVDERTHLGLAIMRARAERSGGALDVQAQPGTGTQITLRYPLPAVQSTPSQEAV